MLNVVPSSCFLGTQPVYLGCGLVCAVVIYYFPKAKIFLPASSTTSPPFSKSIFPIVKQTFWLRKFLFVPGFCLFYVDLKHKNSCFGWP